MMEALLELRATVAMRKEDLRIARKHRDEANARRRGDEASEKAYVGARQWETACAEALSNAETRLVSYLAEEEAAWEATTERTNR